MVTGNVNGHGRTIIDPAARTVELRGANGTIDRISHLSPRVRFDAPLPTEAEIVNIKQISGGLKLLSDVKREYTHEAALRTLELAEFVVAGQLVDRNQTALHVKYLYREMMQGTFFPEWVNVISCICKEPVGNKPAGTEFRMNTQHVSSARLQMPAEWSCPVRFMRYEAETVEDMRVLYASIDNNKVRSHNNKINAYMAGTDGFEDCSPIVLRYLSSGIRLWLALTADTRSGKFNGVENATEIAYQLLHERRELTLRVKSFLIDDIPINSAMSKQTCFRAPIVAAMFGTFAVLAGAGEFWTAVTSGLGATGANDPRFRLHNTLRESKIGSVKGSTARNKAGKKVLSQADMTAQCVNCWNAWRRNEQLTIVRGLRDGKMPRPI